MHSNVMIFLHEIFCIALSMNSLSNGARAVKKIDVCTVEMRGTAVTSLQQRNHTHIRDKRSLPCIS